MRKGRTNYLKDTVIKSINSDIHIIDKEDILGMFNDKKSGTRGKFKLFK